jgi:hypothetical protein
MGRLGRALTRFRKQWPLWSALIACALLGLACILIPAIGGWTWDHGIIRDIGIALLTTAILGSTIHVYLERDIAKNAFEGAVGYFLPDDIKEAVRHLTGIEWFAEQFSWTVDIERIHGNPHLVKVTTKTRKVLRNITNNPLSIKSTIHVDDWGHKTKSTITQCELRGPQIKIELDPTKIEYRNDSTVYAETEAALIGPKEAVELLATGVEYKQENGDLYFAMPYATKSAEIYINAPTEFNTLGGFSTDLPSDKHPHLNKYVVRGFCFPWQRAMVRWWPRKTAE